MEKPDWWRLYGTRQCLPPSQLCASAAGRSPSAEPPLSKPGLFLLLEPVLALGSEDHIVRCCAEHTQVNKSDLDGITSHVGYTVTRHPITQLLSGLL